MLTIYRRLLVLCYKNTENIEWILILKEPMFGRWSAFTESELNLIPELIIDVNERF